MAAPSSMPDIEKIRQLRELAAQLLERALQGTLAEKDVLLFWDIAAIANPTLRISDMGFALKAGVDPLTFWAALQTRGQPEQNLLLGVLTAIQTLADELYLSDKPVFESNNADRDAKDRNNRSPEWGEFTISTHWRELLLLATSLERVARIEIAKIERERPNDPSVVENNRRQRELLEIFANGFARIAIALADLNRPSHRSPVVKRAKDIVDSVGNQIGAWWKQNGTDAVDWGARISFITAGVAMLGWAGADMTIATSAVAAIVGGEKVIGAVRRGRGAYKLSGRSAKST